MSDIKLVITIPEEMYQEIKETYMMISGRRSGKRFDYILFNAVNNGTPLNEVFNKIRAEVEPKCYRINSLASVLIPYTVHREIQELLCEIMDLIKESEE